MVLSKPPPSYSLLFEKIELFVCAIVSFMIALPLTYLLTELPCKIISGLEIKLLLEGDESEKV